jgi:hypothetical protein
VLYRWLIGRFELEHMKLLVTWKENTASLLQAARVGAYAMLDDAGACLAELTPLLDRSAKVSTE